MGNASGICGRVFQQNRPNWDVHCAKQLSGAQMLSAAYTRRHVSRWSYRRDAPWSNPVSIDSPVLVSVSLQSVYLQLPPNLAYSEIQTPVSTLAMKFGSDPGILRDFVRATLDRIAASTHCAILVDANTGLLRCVEPRLRSLSTTAALRDHHAPIRTD